MRYTRLAALTLFAFAAASQAALPPPSDGEKAKAAEAKAKADWEAKHQAYLLCKAQDHAVSEYRTDMEKAGKPTKPSSSPDKPCVDPGPYAVKDATQPLESSGAHSPARPATAPPSTNQHAAEQNKAAPPDAAASKP